MLTFFASLPACRIGIEACAGAHYWARELIKLGHDVRLMAAQFVTPYRKSGKNDANDAEAICEAVGRPGMRFVPVKSEEAQAVLAVHRARALTVAERTALVNQVRGLLGEFGIVAGKGIAQARRLLAEIGAGSRQLPVLARETIGELHDRLRALDERVRAYERKISALAQASEPARRLMAIEGVGPLTATALVASVGNARTFQSGRQFAAWLGLTPRQNSSGGKTTLGSISKRGDVTLRTLLIHGTRSVLRLTPGKTDRKSQWAEALKARSCENVAAVALAAKHARIMWALLARGTEYRSAS
jgi:transposase